VIKRSQKEVQKQKINKFRAQKKKDQVHESLMSGIGDDNKSRTVQVRIKASQLHSRRQLTLMCQSRGYNPPQEYTK
jgi:hypothetical protein